MRRLISLVVVPVVLGVGIVPTPVHGQAHGEESRFIVGEVRSDGVSHEFREDAELLARESGDDTEEVVSDFGGQEDFSSVVTKAYELHPSSFSSSGWTPERLDSEGYGAWVAFTESVGSEAIESFAALSVPVEVRFDAPLSEAEAEDAQSSIVEAITAEGDVKEVMATLEEDGNLSVSVGEPTEGQRAADRAMDAVDDIAREMSESLPVDVSVRAVESLDVDPEVVRGGARVKRCTAAFTAYRGHEKALLGAQHCGRDAGVPTGGTSTLKYVTGHIGRRGDVRVHTTEDPISNHVHLNRAGTKTRKISSRSRVSPGEAVCSYGNTRGHHDCTKVQSVNVTFRWLDEKKDKWHTISGAVRTMGEFTRDGDSGGPWFVGQNALGIHFGKVGGKSTFSNIMDAEAQLSVRVKIN